MYKSYLIPALFLVLFVVAQSCDKDHDKPVEQNPPSSWGSLLKNINWSTGSKEAFTYNADSTLKQIDYTFGNSGHFYEFSWSGKKMVTVRDNTSNYKNTYHYNGNKVLYMENALNTAPVTHSYKMEYTYNAIGKADKMKYIITNDAGSVLKSVTSYFYNTAGDLIRTVTHMDDFIITQTIEGYSQTVLFNPWAFIDMTLLENYMIFNYPVLSTMKGFPTKIARSVQSGNDPVYVDIITSYTCEISNNRINKLTTQLQNPAAPGNNKTYVAELIYQ